MNKRGFTLIELLAVILVLGIVSLIAVVIITKTIDQSKKEAAKVSALEYIEAVEKYMLETRLSSDMQELSPNNIYQLSTEEYEIEFDDEELLDAIGQYNKVDDIYINDIVNASGKKPTSGFVLVNSKKLVEAAELQFGKYVVSYNKKDGVVDVYKAGNTRVESIRITNDNMELEVGETLQLSLEILPTNATYKKIIYSSSNEAVATVSSTGLVTALKNGETTITVRSSNGKIDTKKVVVPTPIVDIAQGLLDSNTTYGNYTYMNGTYLKGKQENNYVWYNGFLWRIMGKNSDNSIRLITEENVTSLPWTSNNAGGPNNWNRTGYIKDWLNSYFYNHLDSSKTDIIKDSNWCINTTTTSGSIRTDCTGGTLVSSKVGLISVDEYNLSGASYANDTYYLVNDQYYWTLTPNSTSQSWYVYNYGSSYSNGVVYQGGVRPVINVDANAMIKSGDGSLENAYILNQSINSKTGDLNDVASSGEYVSLSNRIYRVVAKEEQGIKLIYDGYYDVNDNGIIDDIDRSVFNPTTNKVNTFENSTIKTLLNGDVLNWLGNSNKIKEVNWNQGQVYDNGNPYTTSLSNSGSNIRAKVGLIRAGEMLSGQSTSILTKNYTEISNHNNAQNYWIMTKYTSTTNSRLVSSSGNISSMDVHNNFGVRPVIYVDDDVTVTKGNGTLESPYKID